MCAEISLAFKFSCNLPRLDSICLPAVWYRGGHCCNWSRNAIALLIIEIINGTQSRASRRLDKLRISWHAFAQQNTEIIRLDYYYHSSVRGPLCVFSSRSNTEYFGTFEHRRSRATVTQLRKGDFPGDEGNELRLTKLVIEWRKKRFIILG